MTCVSGELLSGAVSLRPLPTGYLRTCFVRSSGRSCIMHSRRVGFLKVVRVSSLMSGREREWETGVRGQRWRQWKVVE